MNVRLFAALLLAAQALSAAPPAGLACPVPRPLHPAHEDASLRAARDDWRKAPDCCGIVINKLRFSAAGVICWPVSEGDELRAEGWPTIIVFFDGGRLHLSEGSALRLQTPGDAIQVLQGTVSWRLPASSKRRVAAFDKRLEALSGMAQMHEGKLQFTPNAQFPEAAPDLAELLRRFPFTSGRLIPSDGF